MEDKERNREGSYDSVKGGFSISLSGETMSAFMESGDYSSARELDRFKDVEIHIEKRVKEETGLSLIALSVTEERVSRDFAVLQIAHLLAKHGKTVLIVDCDFLNPGLSGVVENIEEQGFLDLLLYGSSLKSISRSLGIDGVSVTGPGSFPVSRTIPFAQKEFGKVNEFLRKRSDVVIYCSTLYKEDGGLNPLSAFVDGVILCCRIEEMEEGQLQKILKEIGSGAPVVDLICFCGERETAEAAPIEKIPMEEGIEGEAVAVEEGIPLQEESTEPVFLEKTEEIYEKDERGKRKVDIPRLVTIVVVIFLVGFISWWFIINRSIRNKEDSSKKAELVQKELKARDADDGIRTPVAAESSAVVKDVEDGDLQEAASSIRKEPAAVTPEAVSEAADSSSTETTATQQQGDGTYYAVHVASFKQIERAGRQMEYYERKGFEARVVEVTVKGERWFRIIIGDFATREEAVAIRMELVTNEKASYARVIKLK